MRKEREPMAKKKKEAEGPAKEKVVCRNRRARHLFEIVDSIEAGIVLTGTEVKSLRGGTASLEDAFARVENGELWVHKLEIPEYAMGNIMNHPVKRPRKLLLHRREIEKFARGSEQRGFTLIPLQLYFKKGRAKLELGLAKGKKTHDKRESIKTKDAKREISRVMSNRRKGRF
jgi:SsrA-binding protein